MTTCYSQIWRQQKGPIRSRLSPECITAFLQSQVTCSCSSSMISFIIIHDSWQFIKLFHKITIKITMKAAVFDNIRVFMMVVMLNSIYGKLRCCFTFRAFLLSTYPATCFHSSYYHFVLESKLVFHKLS